MTQAPNQEPMKPYEKASLIIQVITCAITAAGLASIIYAASGIQKQSDALSSSAYANILDKQLEVDKLFIDNPKLRPYFYNKKPIDSKDTNYAEVIATADYILDFIDLYYIGHN